MKQMTDLKSLESAGQFTALERLLMIVLGVMFLGLGAMIVGNWRATQPPTWSYTASDGTHVEVHVTNQPEER